MKISNFFTDTSFIYTLNNFIFANSEPGILNATFSWQTIFYKKSRKIIEGKDSLSIFSENSKEEILFKDIKEIKIYFISRNISMVSGLLSEDSLEKLSPCCDIEITFNTDEKRVFYTLVTSRVIGMVKRLNTEYVNVYTERASSYNGFSSIF